MASKDTIESWWREVEYRIKTELAPKPTGYRKTVHPYRARYGDDWEYHLGNVTGMKSFCSIKQLALHYYNQAKAHFEKHPPPEGKKWYFYHDALSLMTAKECRDELENLGVWDHWLLPVLELDATGQYHRDQYMAGNSPEYMPWDTSLNNSLHLAVNRYCIFSSHMDHLDPKKMSLVTPKKGAATSIYKKVLAGVPSSGRILHDIKAVEAAIKAVYNNYGAIVEGLGDRSGKRKQSAVAALDAAGVARPNNRGGVRQRNEEKQLQAMYKQWWHPDIEPELDVRRKQSLAKFEQDMEQVDDFPTEIADLDDLDGEEEEQQQQE